MEMLRENVKTPHTHVLRVLFKIRIFYLNNFFLSQNVHMNDARHLVSTVNTMVFNTNVTVFLGKRYFLKKIWIFGGQR